MHEDALDVVRTVATWDGQTWRFDCNGPHLVPGSMLVIHCTVPAQDKARAEEAARELSWRWVRQPIAGVRWQMRTRGTT